MNFRELAQVPRDRLEQIFASSRGPALDSLAGWEWRGLNLSLLTKIARIEKFIKGFFRSGQEVEGYNIPARQNGADKEWIAKPSRENPQRFGFYRVHAVEPGSRDNFYPRAVLLDYGASPRNAGYRPERVLRDYLVNPDPANADLVLGKAYLALAGVRVPVNFFILERFRPTLWTAE